MVLPISTPSGMVLPNRGIVGVQHMLTTMCDAEHSIAVMLFDAFNGCGASAADSAGANVGTLELTGAFAVQVTPSMSVGVGDARAGAGRRR
jgi:hypothetical protein